jgi:hypothetical protein
MHMRKGGQLDSSAEAIVKLLEENQGVLEERSQSHLLIYFLTALISAIIAFTFFSGVIHDKPGLLLLFTAGASLLGVLIVYWIVCSVAYKIDTSVVLAYKASKRGWSFSSLDPEGIWNSWSSKYPFLQKGDMDDAIVLRVYGDCAGFSFCYFEYDYTIEIEEEVEYEDSNGNTYYETEYSYEYYTESGMIVDVRHNLPYIKTLAGSVRSDALKFSYIDLNTKMSAYSSNPQSAAVYFDPATQRVFSSFYHYYPSADMSIEHDCVFINFGTDLSNLSRTLRFDENLLSYIRGNQTVDLIEGIMLSLLPLLKTVNR